MDTKPYSQASENNKDHILLVLKSAFKDAKSVLEVGSGTGQHAVHFAANLPHLLWQPTDMEVNISGIKLWLDEASLTNLNDPITLDVNNLPWQLGNFDAIYTANTLHIMGTSEIENFFQGISKTLNCGGTLCIYGPFNYGGNYTSPSNQRFDGWLKKNNPESAIRDFEWVNSLASNIGLSLVHDHEMPANNRLLQWSRED